MNGIGPFRHQRGMSLEITRWCLWRSPGDVRREHRLMSGEITRWCWKGSPGDAGGLPFRSHPDSPSRRLRY